MGPLLAQLLPAAPLDICSEEDAAILRQTSLEKAQAPNPDLQCSAPRLPTDDKVRCPAAPSLLVMTQAPLLVLAACRLLQG